MISVVIPVYNAEKYLRRTVASVQAQTLPDWEIVLMDDGSQDSSLQIAEDLCREDSRISSFRQANAGGSAARSHGIEKSNPAFPYVLCLDNDDLLLPEALGKLLALLELNPQAPAACGSLLDIDSDDAVLAGHDRLEPLTARRGVDGLRLIRRKPNAPLAFGDLCFRNHIVTPGQVLIRKSAIRTAGAFDTSLIYIDDRDLWWRLTMQIGPIPVLAEPVLLYRHHGANLTGNKTAGRTSAAAFRWRLLTYPAMTPSQRRTACLGYFYDCIAQFGFGLHYLRKGERQHGSKRLALGVRDTLRFFRDWARARRYLAAHEKAASLFAAKPKECLVLPSEEPAHLLCIATVANDLTQYAQMRRSLADAGFTDERCRFVLLDNSLQNAHEPYSAINQTLDEATEPYVIACHQDILLDQGPAFDQLLSQIELLNTRHPDWAVAGNCGNKSNLAGICHLHDPNGFHHAAPLPQQVQTLDENFLVIRRASGVRCSAELSGFHLYATDLCLHAAQLGFSCFVIDFYFTHLSGGNTGSDHFHAGLHEFQQHWNPKFAVRLIRTPCMFFYLSRYSVVRRLLAQKPIMQTVRAGFKAVRVAQAVSAGKQPACP